MKKLKSLLAVCLASVVCFLIFCGCSDEIFPSVNPAVTDGSITFVLYAEHRAVITVENGAYTGGKMYTHSGEYIGTFTAEYLEKSKNTRLECVYDNGIAPLLTAVKTVLTVDRMGNLVESVIYNSNGEALDLRTYDFKYNRSGHPVRCRAYFNGEFWYEAEYALGSNNKSYMYKMRTDLSLETFNSYGDTVSHISYGLDGAVEYEYTYEYEYNDSGKILKCTRYRDGVWEFAETVTYDDFGRFAKVVIESTYTYFERMYTYDEDENEYIVEKNYIDYLYGVTKKKNGVESYMASYYPNGNVEWEMLYREDTNRVRIMEKGRTMFQLFPYLSINYDENGVKTEERFYEPVYENGAYTGRQITEETIYKDKYSKKLYEYGDDFQIIRFYDESKTLVYTYKYEDVHDAKGRLIYRNEYENGELKIRSVYSTEGELMFTNIYVDGELKIQNIYKWRDRDINKDGKIKETRASNFEELPSLDR